jgi:hypothetical protein
MSDLFSQDLYSASARLGLPLDEDHYPKILQNLKAHAARRSFEGIELV